MLARDIMTRPVISVSPDDTVQQLARVLTDGGVSGAPVIGEDGRLVGIVSEADVISKRGPHVHDVMHRSVVTVGEETEVAEVCSLMTHRNINRVPVVTDERVVGIVTRADVVRAISKGSIAQDTLVEEQAE